MFNLRRIYKLAIKRHLNYEKRGTLTYDETLFRISFINPIQFMKNFILISLDAQGAINH